MWWINSCFSDLKLIHLIKALAVGLQSTNSLIPFECLEGFSSWGIGTFPKRHILDTSAIWEFVGGLQLEYAEATRSQVDWNTCLNFEYMFYLLVPHCNHKGSAGYFVESSRALILCVFWRCLLEIWSWLQFPSSTKQPGPMQENWQKVFSSWSWSFKKKAFVKSNG